MKAVRRLFGLITTTLFLLIITASAVFADEPASNDLSNAEITSDWEDNTAYYSTALKDPVITVSLNGQILTENTDYVVIPPIENFGHFGENRLVGTYIFTIQGIGSYTGQKQITFTCRKGTLSFALKSKDSWEPNQVRYDPDGTPVAEIQRRGRCDVWVGDLGELQDGHFWTATADPVNTVKALYVSGIYSQTGKRNGIITIEDMSTQFNKPWPDECWFTITSTSPLYEDASVQFKVRILDPLLSENATVTVTKKDRFYSPTAPVTLGPDDITVTAGDTVLEYGKDYTLSYENNDKVGEATVTVTATPEADYRGSISTTFEILPIEGLLNVSSTDLTIVYGQTAEITLTDGGELVPTVTIDEAIADLKVFYEPKNHRGTIELTGLKPGLTHMTITQPAESNYLEKVITAQVEIIPATLTQMNTVITVPDAAYDGTAKEPPVSVTVYGMPLDEAYYEAVYTKNTEGPVATVTVKGKNGFGGSASAYFKILRQPTALRVYGSNRATTSLAIAEQLKKLNGGKAFDAVVLCTGENYPDALAGGYLANVKNAPILLLRDKKTDRTKVVNYIKKNLKKKGKIYVLGSTAAVPDSWISGLKSYSIKRLQGSNRFKTNAAILTEIGASKGREIIATTGYDFPDALCASALDKPLLLLDSRKTKKLAEAQITYLKNVNKSVKPTIYLVGDRGKVASFEKELSAYGSVVWVSDNVDPVKRSVAIAGMFFERPDNVAFARCDDYPDGLCGSVLANRNGAPLLLTEMSETSDAVKAYIVEAGASRGYIFGSTKAVGNGPVKSYLPKVKISEAKY